MPRTLKYLAALTLMTAALPATATAAPDNGKVLVTCGRTGVAAHRQVDPILNYSPTDPFAPSGHDHFAEGSTAFSASLTLPDLLVSATNCDVPSDTSEYWHPTALAPDGTTVVPNNFSIYYRGLGRQTPTFTFPLGFRFISGDHTNLLSSKGAARWQCGNGGTQRTAIPSAATCTDAAGVHGLQETMAMSSCWDGLHYGPGLGSDITGDASTYMAAAPTNPATGRPNCPADHPIPLPSFQLVINWPSAILGGKLSSDDPGAAPGASAHADFVNGWKFNSQGKEALPAIVNECLNVDTVDGNASCKVIAGRVVRMDGSYVTD